ncbi:hypothetical protein [Brevundimonas naejangsanensis]|uniref:hypothetical protein n=1 Tax=Brevundimonas naejangsanensis TaxID=588932 RepID=UPI00320A594B
MSSKLVALATALALINAPSEAGKTDSSGLWRQMAEVDSAAALQLITENHPGARPELGDASFQQRLAAAAHHVEQRLPEVRNFDGYSALMAGLAADFADGHIWSRSRVQKQTLQWTGVLLKREGQVWRVGSVLPEARLPDIQNARLVECDRVDAEHWADARIRLFVAGEPNEAQRVEAAGRLLTDDGNPFLKRPEQCTFETTGGARESITFRWGQGPTSFVNERIEALQRRAADGYSLTPWRNGYWIRLSGLDDDAEAVVATVQQAETQLRNSTNVILDLRGNGGGDSRYGDAIATTLFGADRVREVATQGSACVGAFWRASAQNIAALKSFRDARTRTDAKTSAALGEVVEGMEKSLANGEPFWPNLPVCAVDQALPIVAAHSPSDAKVVIITDHLCFSSCLVTVDLFRKLGALHVGEATDVSSRYMEVRTILLPSGLRDFSTLQKIAVGLPDFGPYSPDIPYPGEMADDEALKTWLQVQLASR